MHCLSDFVDSLMEQNIDELKQAFEETLMEEADIYLIGIDIEALWESFREKLEPET